MASEEEAAGDSNRGETLHSSLVVVEDDGVEAPHASAVPAAL